MCLTMGEWQALHLAPQPGASTAWAQVHVCKGTHAWASMCTHQAHTHIHTPLQVIADKRMVVVVSKR